MEMIINTSCNKYVKIPDDIIRKYMIKKYGICYIYTRKYDYDIKRDIEIDNSDGSIYVHNNKEDGIFISHEYLGDKINDIPLKYYLTDIYDPILINILKEYNVMYLKVIDISDEDIENKGENVI